MSEQTTDQTSDSTQGVGLSDAEPSMEDILASIRKIIADDADPVPLDGPGPVAGSLAEADAVADLSVDSLIESIDMAPLDLDPVKSAPVELAEVDVAQVDVASAEPASLATDDFDIDALLSGLDVVEPEAPPTPGRSAGPIASLTPAEALDLDGFDSAVDLAIPDLPDDAVDTPVAAPAATALGERAAASILATVEAPAVPAKADAAGSAGDVGTEDELNSLMDELLSDLDLADGSPAEAEAPVPTDAGAADDPESHIREMPEIDSTEDMDLVRSLMADLTDDDVMAADVDGLEPVDTSADAASLYEEDDQVDVLDDILDMTLSDAVADDALDIPDPEPDFETSGIDAAPSEDTPSLSDIAAAADQDARSVTLPVAATAAGAALMGGATLAASSEPATASEASDAAPEIADTPDTTTPTPPPLETPMPRAMRSEAILDEVTEEATASAFAELNQVVEEKAVYSERGPRIGDLVQEALKPMLKEWLDANLKGIVERAVAKEVKRISTGK